MGLPIGGLEASRRHVRVDLRRREVLVTEELLDDAQVGAAVEQMRGERVPQRVRRHADRQTGAHAQAIEPVAQPAHAERSATVVEEDLDRRRLVTVMALQEDLPTVLEIRAQRPPGRPPEEPDALLAALADDP